MIKYHITQYIRNSHVFKKENIEFKRFISLNKKRNKLDIDTISSYKIYKYNQIKSVWFNFAIAFCLISVPTAYKDISQNGIPFILEINKDKIIGLRHGSSTFTGSLKELK